MSKVEPVGRAPRMTDVARHAGVALGTVSNVLNRPEKVAPDTRTRVLAAMDELGFVLDRRARALAAGTSGTIGFVVVDLSNSFFLDMARGAEREASRQGMNVVLANADMQPEKQDVYLRLFEEERVGGMLLAPIPDADPTLLRPRPSGREMVVLNVDLGGDQCSVASDNELGGYLAACHLVETGCRRLLLAVGSFEARPLRDRSDGVHRAVEGTNGAVSLSVFRTDEVQVEDGRRVGRHLLSLPAEERPDGVVATSDLLAQGIVQVLRSESDLRIPQDVSIVGYDNNRAAWDSQVPLTTMSQPGEEMGQVATRLLLEEIRTPGAHRHQHVVLQPTLVQRESTRRPRS